MKIYTRKGDTGETDLFGGDVGGGLRRVSKDSLRIDAIGAVDEVNSWIGMVVDAMGDRAGDAWTAGEGASAGEVRDNLIEIQKDLFVLGADLATPGTVPVRGEADVPRVSDGRVSALEALIDRLQRVVGVMTAFILPGGCESAARLHVARSVCRRAERACVRLVRARDDDELSAGNNVPSGMVVKYLNRLSDLLFVMARWENMRQGVDETKWRG